MKKRKGVGFFIFLMLMLIIVPNISAIDTKVKVTTYSNHELNINFLNPPPGALKVFKVYNLNSGLEGEVNFIFSSEEPKFDITTFVMKDGEKIVYERFDGNIAGESIYLRLFPGDSEIIKNFVEEENETEETNETVNETSNENEVIENITVESLEEDKEQVVGITGAATSDDESRGGLQKNLLYYIFGLLVLSAIVFTGVMKIKKRPTSSKEVKVKKLSEKLEELKEDKKSKPKDYHQAIEEAEKKIQEAQKEINKLKNADKIDEIKRRMIEDQKELLKLREGDD
ncbi:MAG: hypothetical protein ABIH59_01305 [archaeon]